MTFLSVLIKALDHKQLKTTWAKISRKELIGKRGGWGVFKDVSVVHGINRRPKDQAWEPAETRELWNPMTAITAARTGSASESNLGPCSKPLPKSQSPDGQNEGPGSGLMPAPVDISLQEGGWPDPLCFYLGREASEFTLPPRPLIYSRRKLESPYQAAKHSKCPSSSWNLHVFFMEKLQRCNVSLTSLPGIRCVLLPRRDCVCLGIPQILVQSECPSTYSLNEETNFAHCFSDYFIHWHSTYSSGQIRHT